MDVYMSVCVRDSPIPQESLGQVVAALLTKEPSLLPSQALPRPGSGSETTPS